MGSLLAAVLVGATLIGAPSAATAATVVTVGPASTVAQDVDPWDIPPINTSAPRIVGKPMTGKRVSANIGEWENADEYETRLEWLINGSVQPEQEHDDEYYYSTDPEGQFLIPANAAGKKLSVRVVAYNGGGLSTKATSASVIITAPAYAMSPAPIVDGTARVGSKLTARIGKWSPTPSFTYRWQRNGNDISGATSSSYTPTKSDLGKRLRVRIQATKSGYHRVLKFSLERKVTAGSLKPARPLSIGGTAKYGKTVTAKASWPSGSKASYRWYRSGKAIAKATKPSLRIGSSDVGHKILVKAVVTKPGYTTLRTSSKTVKVGKGTFVLKSKPKVSGSKKIGYTLTSTRGSFSPSPSSRDYRWYRNGKAIGGATRSSYRITSADKGKRLTVRVTAKHKNYSNAIAESSGVNIPVPIRTVLSSSGTFKVGRDIRPGLYRATSGGKGCYWERTSGFSGSLSQIKANYYGIANTYVRILPGDKGFKTSGCGKWTTVNTAGAKASKITRNGTYRVGIDIKPGTYEAFGKGIGCYWAVLNDFTGELNDIEDNYYGSARTIVDVPASAKGFTVSGCGTFRR